ncbi:MAG: BsuPI-related putative proteinase inhibitor [Candidatus Hadarchaeaceae archaeon]
MKTTLKSMSAISLMLFASFMVGGVILEQGLSSAMDRSTSAFVEDGVELRISVQKTEFRRGENIDMTLAVKNHRNENVTFEFSNGHQFDFVVYDKNFEVVCTWSDDKAFIQALTGFALEPGESRNWVWNWDQMVYNDDTGEYSPIGLGTYHLRGILVGYMKTPHIKIVIL